MNTGSNGEGATTASSPIAKITTPIVWLGGAISTVLILVAFAVTVYAVINRYVLNSPLLWADELIGYFLVALVMFGAAEAYRRNDHIAIDLLSSKTSGTAALILAVISDLSVLAFAAVLGISTWEAVTFAYSFGSYSSGYIEIETWIPQSPLLAGAALFALAALEKLIGRFAGHNQNRS